VTAAAAAAAAAAETLPSPLSPSLACSPSSASYIQHTQVLGNVVVCEGMFMYVKVFPGPGWHDLSCSHITGF
jgi:hypothetical protein